MVFNYILWILVITEHRRMLAEDEDYYESAMSDTDSKLVRDFGYLHLLQTFPPFHLVSVLK